MKRYLGELIKQNKKGDRFCFEGQSAFYIGFIEYGSFKNVVKDCKGKEQIIGFSFKDALVGDYLSIINQEPARSEIIAIIEGVGIISSDYSHIFK